MKKRFLSLLLAITMLFSVTATAFADNTASSEQLGTITICGTVEGKQYDLYRVFDLTQQGDHFNYTLNSAFEGFFTGKIGGDSQPATAIDYVNERQTAGTLSQFARELTTWAITNNIAKTTVTGAATSPTTVPNMPYGYYLLNPLGGFGPSTTPGTATMFSLGTLSGAQGDCTINLKAAYPTIDKKIVDGANRVKVVDAAIGDVINYEVKSKAPDRTGYASYIYKFTDIMDKGLTYNNDAKVIVNGADKTSVFTVTTGPSSDGGTIVTITANDALATFDGIAGKDVVVTYSATLNEYAKIGEANKNGVTLTYSNNPKTDSTGSTLEVETSVWTTSLDIFKYFCGEAPTNPTEPDPSSPAAVNEGSCNKVALAGAKFRIKGPNLNKVIVVGKGGTNLIVVNEGGTPPVYAEDLVIESGDNKGHLIFKGLKSGTYTITEIETPNGFVKMEDKTITISFEGTKEDGKFSLDNENWYNTLNMDIENISGSELPGTGGIGTSIFYTLGLGLVIASGAAFAVKRKRNI